jgi:hypothetical protein
MPTSSITRHNDTCGNPLLSELLGYDVAYRKATKLVTKDQPFLSFYRSADEIELDHPETAKAASDDPHAMYIVAPDSAIQSFSLIKRVALPNKLGDLPKNALRKALGTLLDNA